MPNIFPDILADRMVRGRIKFQNRIRRADAGLQVNVPHDVHLISLRGEYGVLSGVDLDTIMAHFAINGALWFTIYDNPRYASSIPSGTGNGVLTVFTIPAKAVTGGVAKVNGVTTAATLLVGTGSEGEDQWSFGAPPANGAAITTLATSARRRYYVWYTTEKPEEEPVEADIWRLALEFEEKFP